MNENAAPPGVTAQPGMNSENVSPSPARFRLIGGGFFHVARIAAPM